MRISTASTIAPDDGADTTGDQADHQLSHAQAGVAEVDPANAHETDQTQQLQQSRDTLDLSESGSPVSG